jgi:hypothetical protein
MDSVTGARSGRVDGLCQAVGNRRVSMSIIKMHLQNYGYV